MNRPYGERNMRTLAEFRTFLRPLLRLMARSATLHSTPPLHELLKTHPRLIFALSHGTPLSWLPTVSLLAVEAANQGGAQRTPLGVMDKVFFKVPVIREIARMITQTREALSYFELYDRFERGGEHDLVVFPEGSNCFFGRPDVIQEFRSNKFLDLAIRTETPLVIGVHDGSEAWAKAWDVPPPVVARLDFLPQFAFDFVEKRIKRSGLFVLPLLPKPMDNFEVRLELYRTQLTRQDLALEPFERATQLQAESARVRARMSEMLFELRSDREAREEKALGTTELSRSEMTTNLNNL